MRYEDVIMKIISYCLLFIFSLSGTAAELKSAQSKQIAQQLQKTINQKLAEIVALELELGTPLEDISVNLSQNRRFDSGRFGAILDANLPGKVVSVTPRSQAAELGLLSGDVILEVNGEAPDFSSRTWHESLQNLPNNTKVSIKVLRQQQEQLLAGKLKAQFIPKWELMSLADVNLDGSNVLSHIPYWQPEANGPIFESQYDIDEAMSEHENECGRIIVVNSLSISPAKYSGLKSTVVVKEVDGFQWLMDKSRLRIGVGKHIMRIGDKFDLPKDFKDFSINVEADTNYYIAFTRKKNWVDSNGEELVFGQYTGPVIWKTTQQACNF